MRAMRLSRPAVVEDFPLELVEMPNPRPGAGQVLLRVLTCGVCHTDLHICEGELNPKTLPIIPGHQVVAEVVALGQSVEGYGIGERVGVAWLHQTCSRCTFCLRGQENLCRKARFTGFDLDGGFSELMVAEVGGLLPIPSGVTSLHAAPLLCAGIIGYRSLLRAGLQPGERLGLFGFGASAHLAIQVALYWDCEVYVFTRSSSHRRHAEGLGAAWTGESTDNPPIALDRAVIFAPSGLLVPQALEKLRPGGVLAINAIHMSPIPEMPYPLIYGERALTSVTNATRQDGLDFLRLAAEIPVRSTVSEYALEDANDALLDLKERRLNGQAVLRIGQSPTLPGL